MLVASIGLAMLSQAPSGMVTAKAILGVDLGSLYMKVALVQRGAPLEIVTNFHSKRKTEQVILLDSGSRFYGADAYSLLARKPTKTPAAMTLLLGRSDDHPAVKVSLAQKLSISWRSRVIELTYLGITLLDLSYRSWSIGTIRFCQNTTKHVTVWF